VNGRIVEELESVSGEGTERRASSKIALSFELSQAIIHPYRATGLVSEANFHLPAHATEIQPPESEINHDNMNTIQQRDEQESLSKDNDRNDYVDREEAKE